MVSSIAKSSTAVEWCYSNLGFSFTPLTGKRPVRSGWQAEPRESLDQAVEWSDAGNLGVRTGAASAGLVVIDVDPGGDVSALDLPDTVRVRTGGGGEHWYFKFNRPLKNAISKLSAQIDFKADGGQVVFPGSIHPDTGNAYEFIEGFEPWSIAIADLPAHIIKLLNAPKASRTAAPASQAAEPGRVPASHARPVDRKSRYIDRAIKFECAAVASAVEGTRNDQLNKSGYSLGRIVAAGMIGRSEVEQALHDAASSAGLSHFEADATIQSALGASANDPRDIEAELQKSAKRPAKPASNVTPGSAQSVDNTPSGNASDAPAMVALGERDPDTGRIVLSPRRTLPTAQAFKREFCMHETDGRALHHYADAFWRWSDNRYQTWSDNAIRAELQPWLHLALRYVVNRHTQQPELADFECNNGTIEGALASIRSHVYLNESLVSPAWIGEATERRPDPRELLPFKSGTLHIPTGDVIPPTPLLFNVNALDFDYDPNAPDPLNWFDFLLTLWPGDPYQIETLQQWFGYCLTGDTSQQKILLMVGPKRSGKGTIARVLRRLVGMGNVAGPTISSLSGAFGLADLVDKSLAIVADARFGGPAMPTVTERLLQISGEDMITIDRKHRDAINLKLPTRFMILTNELPRLSDSSGALSGRFIMLHLVESFYGREDLALESKLIAELPGILKWAIEGWKMLHERGRFVQPESARELMNSLEDLTSPVGAFVRDVCEIGPECREWVDVLYEAWRQWCIADGRINPTTKQMFGRDLAACLPSVSIKRGTSNVRFYSGVKLGAS